MDKLDGPSGIYNILCRKICENFFLAIVKQKKNLLLIKPPLTYTLSDYGKCKKSRFGANCTFLRNKVRFESKKCAIYKHCKTKYFTEVILSALKFPLGSDVKASNIQGMRTSNSAFKKRLSEQYYACTYSEHFNRNV